MPLLSPRPADPSPTRRSRRDRVLIGLSLLTLLAACVSLGLFWKQWTGPGKRYYQQGLEYAGARRYDLAERAWRKGVEKDPQSWQCYERLGDLYTELARPPDAAEAYEAATKITPNNGTLFLKLMRTKKASGDVPGALAAAQRATALLPKNAEAAGEYGLLAAQKRQDLAAMGALRQSLDLDPSSVAYRLALVSLEIDNLDIARAERDLAPYLSGHPDDLQAHYFMAVILNQKPRTPENVRLGIDHAERALPFMLRDPHIYGLLGTLFLAAGRTAAAYRVFTEGYRVAPHYLPILRGLIDCSTRLGRTQQAAEAGSQLEKEAARLNEIEHLKNVLGFNHRDVASALKLARLNEEAGRQEQALGCYVQILRGVPHDQRIRRSLSAFLRRSGRPDMAQRVLRPDFVP